ncbi:GIY-YIG nuclease family protein [Endozoicomonas acroporae]|uniref:GIY-YIG nuclease family protein n=1 Tax=Endozoicomonas acroporae TaxID=1701104 RepID=UPI0013D6BC0A|nr:GIY-YIG nuclease family protein [Endozoicomonas acroporae]
MSDEYSSGIVYVLTNPAMPGIVKIGKTSRGDIHARLNELYSTGVPLPFECAYAGKVEDESKVEKAFHLAFGPYRVNAKREFFQIEPEQAITLLELMVIEDCTPALQQEASSIDQAANEASKKLKSKRPNYNFKEMGIPVGSILHFTQNQEETVQVVDERKVLFRGNESSLTAATREILNNSYHVAPCPYWMYQGKSLRDIYNETYE